VHARRAAASGIKAAIQFDCILSFLIGQCMVNAIGIYDWSVVISSSLSSRWAVVDGRDLDHFDYSKILSVDHGYSALNRWLY
jgi:hypothetical protein